MEHYIISNQTREQLRKPLPQEAISQHPTKKFLSTIKAIYVIERLNDVFGVGGWTFTSEFIERAEKMVVLKIILTIPAYNITLEAYGGNDNVDLGDAYKGATTDAITKIGSYLEIGIDVFKGKHTHNSAPEPTTTKLVADNNSGDKLLYNLMADEISEVNNQKGLDDVLKRIKGNIQKLSQDQKDNLRDLFDNKKAEISLQVLND